MERVYVKYEPNNNLPTHKSNLHIEIEKEFKALTSAVCVTNEDNQKFTSSQKELTLMAL